jgi:hypothetical protein
MVRVKPLGVHRCALHNLPSAPGLERVGRPLGVNIIDATLLVALDTPSGLQRF